jgi:hypothetical protein
MMQKRFSWILPMLTGAAVGHVTFVTAFIVALVPAGWEQAFLAEKFSWVIQNLFSWEMSIFLLVGAALGLASLNIKPFHRAVWASILVPCVLGIGVGAFLGVTVDRFFAA